jgi:hypothetical protein
VSRGDVYCAIRAAGSADCSAGLAGAPRPDVWGENGDGANCSNLVDVNDGQTGGGGKRLLGALVSLLMHGRTVRHYSNAKDSNPFR